jgi:hypothetical protein
MTEKLKGIHCCVYLSESEIERLRTQVHHVVMMNRTGIQSPSDLELLAITVLKSAGQLEGLDLPAGL